MIAAKFKISNWCVASVDFCLKQKTFFLFTDSIERDECQTRQSLDKSLDESSDNANVLLNLKASLEFQLFRFNRKETFGRSESEL